MSDLSEDLVEEILSRVPTTSLKRLRSTCKLWNTLFKDKRFANKQFCNAPKQSLILTVKEYRMCSIGVNLKVAPPSIEFKDELNLKDYHSNLEQVDIAKAFHCDGLLLCHLKDNRLVVWNPCLGETRWIQPKVAYKKFFKFALGYQNNNSFRRYKILRYCNVYNQGHFGGVEWQIYELSSGIWRVLDDINPNYFTTGDSAVSMKGNYYCLASHESNYFLLSFDFTTEKFKRLCLPPPQKNHGFFMALSAFREEQLSVVHRRSDTSKIEIWLTNKFDTDDALLWSKSFTVDYSHGRLYANVLIDEEKKVALCSGIRVVTSENNKVYTVGGDKKYYSEIVYMESTEPKYWLHQIVEQCEGRLSWWPLIFNYVPSLLQIQ